MALVDPEREAHIVRLGVHFGYPMCCIREFLDNHEAEFAIRERASAYTGFIPCVAHARQIVRKEITLESLIQDRRERVPFPDGCLRALRW